MSFWQGVKPEPRMTIRVGDVLTIAEFGRSKQITITALTDTCAFYCGMGGGIESVIALHNLKEKILDLTRLRDQVDI